MRNGIAASGQLMSAETFAIIAVIVAAVLLLWMIASYVMSSLTLHNIGKRRGLKLYGMAWVPVASVWSLGCIADDYDAHRGIKRVWRWVMVIMAAAAFVPMTMFCIRYFDLLFATISSAKMGTNLPIEDPYLMIHEMLLLYAYLIPATVLLQALTACKTICGYKLFESCKPKAAMRLLLLSLLVPFAAPFCLLSCMKWDNGVKVTSEQTALPVVATMDEADSQGL